MSRIIWRSNCSQKSSLIVDSPKQFSARPFWDPGRGTLDVPPYSLCRCIQCIKFGASFATPTFSPPQKKISGLATEANLPVLDACDWSERNDARLLSLFENLYSPRTVENNNRQPYFTSVVQLRFDIIRNKRICCVKRKAEHHLTTTQTSKQTARKFTLLAVYIINCRQCQQKIIVTFY